MDASDRDPEKINQSKTELHQLVEKPQLASMSLRIRGMAFPCFVWPMRMSGESLRRSLRSNGVGKDNGDPFTPLSHHPGSFRLHAAST